MNVAERLRAVARATPDQPFLISADRTIRYAEALTAAESLAAGLAARSVRRFAVAVGDPVDVVLLLLAGALGGAEPCCYPRDLDANAIEEYAELFDHDVVVADRALALAGRDVIPLVGLGQASDGQPVGELEEPTLLILTTGTTGRPKAARHEWSRLAPRVAQDEPGDARWLLAYNLNQFAGIQVLLQVLASHAALVIPASNQPRQALAAMRDLGVTHASGTPTFWRFVCSLLDAAAADVPPLQQITLGGEAVSDALLTDLAKHFRNVKVSQIYASTELGSTVSVRDGRAGLPLSVLDRGSDADVQFRIVDGELHARSRVGMLGYQGQADTADDWRPTGDLVEVQGDRIMFVGRTSEVINVGGVKVHPLPIEAAIAAVDGVELVHVYGRPNAVTGQIVAVDVVAVAGADQDTVEEAIRDACASLPRAAQPRRIRFVDDLGVRENKVVRSAEAPTP